MNPSSLQIFATVVLALAIIHTFVVGFIEKFAHRFPEKSLARNLLHYLCEVEAVFGLWALILVIGMIFFKNMHETFTSKLTPFKPRMSFYITTLVLGPLLGSFITEPGAMTVCAMIILKEIYNRESSDNFKYATLGLLFVNISIGGTLTHFAAPPVVMVASKWGWGLSTMFLRYGYKAVIAIVLSTLIVTTIFRKEFNENKPLVPPPIDLPYWIIVAHILFITLVVYSSHHAAFFLGVFLFFVGFTSITRRYQNSPKLRESVMVGFFLAGLVTLGTLQDWWLQQLIAQLNDVTLYLGATALTAITDNAALTYLGSLVNLSESGKYFLVAGAVVGGGLTVIANAPNPVGYGILKTAFGESGVSPLKLFLAAIGPTLIALIFLGLLPNLI